MPAYNDPCAMVSMDKRQRRKSVSRCLKVAAEILKPEDTRTAPAVVAEAMGVCRQYVYRWIQSGYIPPAQAVRLEKMTSGAVDRREANPKIFC